MNYVAVSTLRNNLADTLSAINKTKDYMVVLGRGKPKAVLVNLDLFEDLLDKNDRKYLASIKEAREQIKRGEAYTHDEVFGEI
jgi:PHD/YefM family antitoxin component YafN of YafNO toxin-antitoxin module